MENTESKSPQIPKEKRTKCEIWSRVVGYLRPKDQWNDGKKEEFPMRTRYTTKEEPK